METIPQKAGNYFSTSNTQQWSWIFSVKRNGDRAGLDQYRSCLLCVCWGRERRPKGKVLVQKMFNLMSFEAGPQRTHQRGSLKCSWWKGKNGEGENKEGKQDWRKRSWKDNPQNISSPATSRATNQDCRSAKIPALGIEPTKSGLSMNHLSTNLEASGLLQDLGSPWAPSTRAPQGRQSARAWQCLWKLPLQYSCWKASRRYQPSIKQQQVQAQLVRIKTYTGGNRGTGLGFQLRHQIGLQEITPQGLG